MSIKIISETRHIQTPELRLGLVSGLLTSEVAVLMSAFNPSRVYCHRQPGWSNTILGLLERKNQGTQKEEFPRLEMGNPVGVCPIVCLHVLIQC